MAGHPEFVQVRWDDLVFVLDDPDSPARFKLNEAMADAYAAWVAESGAVISSPDPAPHDDTTDQAESTERALSDREICPLCDGEGCEDGCGRRGGCRWVNAGPESHRVCNRCAGSGRDPSVVVTHAPARGVWPESGGA